MSPSIRQSPPQSFLRRFIDAVTGRDQVLEVKSNSMGQMAQQSRSIDRFEMIGSPNLNSLGTQGRPPVEDPQILAYLDKVAK
ncbi:MAG: hypothetical protein HYS22_03670 [Deltaproteobacteria bacterium]|nr:hypothetical protein [Deltaproteobacteria bacterium]